MATLSPAELAALRSELEASAPPGHYVADLWLCSNGHCDDVHALVLVDDRDVARVGAERRPRRGRRR